MFTIIGYCRKSRSVAASAMGCFQCFCLGTFLLPSVSAHAGLFSSSKKPAQLVIQPPAIELHGAKDIQGLLVTAVMPDGSQIDVTDSARFSSKQPKIVSISTNGLCRPVSDGTDFW